MRILATGGAGYVGSHCIKLLHEQGHSVVVYDNLLNGHRQAVPADLPLVCGDLLDRFRLRQVFEANKFDAVIHFAALLNVNESTLQPQRYYENNVVGALNLLGEMMRQDVRRLVFSSSCAVYGIPSRVPITEDLPKHPISPYGRSKWMVELALQDQAVATGLGSVSLRYFNASGAASDGSLGEDRDPEYHLIPVVLQVPLGRRPMVHVFGSDYPTADGTAVRDYVHVEDLAQAHLLAVEAIQQGTARAYNVGTGRGTSVMEVIDAARRVTNHSIPIEMAPRRAGDPPELYADPALIRRELGWQPRFTSIQDIVASAWDWHRNHRMGYPQKFSR